MKTLQFILLFFLTTSSHGKSVLKLKIVLIENCYYAEIMNKSSSMIKIPIKKYCSDIIRLDSSKLPRMQLHKKCDESKKEVGVSFGEYSLNFYTDSLRNNYNLTNAPKDTIHFFCLGHS